MEKDKTTTQTATQAFCKVCGPVPPTHKCEKKLARPEFVTIGHMFRGV